VTGAALREFLHEFAAIRSGDVSAEEVAKAQANFRTSLVEDYSDLGSVLQSAITLLRNGRSLDGSADDLRAAQAVTPSIVNQMAKSAIPLEQGILVLVGDRQTVLDQIRDLDLPAPVELTVSGERKR
jgi:predicted Zn-dependent peptidase